MGKYLNPGNDAFNEAISSQIYVDKSGLIEYTNMIIGTMQKNLCVSRPRRFGKSMTAHMLAAYYSKGCDSEKMFAGLNISGCGSFRIHLNTHNVIFLNTQRFLSRESSTSGLVEKIESELTKELREAYGDCMEAGDGRLVSALENIYEKTGDKYIFIIDEWDCIFREKKANTDIQSGYLDFLRDMLKDQPYVELAYMTGILPIKKYGTHSALNMFDEYSMTDPDGLAEYIGFTGEEVQNLCRDFQMSFSETRFWYDGYRYENGLHIYSPKSVVDAMRRRRFGSYWTKTETYEALRVYIDMNFDGLKDAIIMMLGGGVIHIDTGMFQNDMTTFASKDDVLTLLVHLGYLAYDPENALVSIPNEEVRGEFVRAVRTSGWPVMEAIDVSEKLLENTLAGDEQAVAEGIEAVHMESTSILNYNDENALSCVIALAYYSARNYYTFVRECPAGKGFADMVFVPRKGFPSRPAIIVELKWDKSAEGAIAQIESRKYPESLTEYKDNILLVGINYDQKSKKHICVIKSYN
ncbi:MAG: ATP-binding protein [Clostridiales bacterium]|nr:ATP-binding protein [Clostridiales bacterium]